MWSYSYLLLLCNDYKLNFIAKVSKKFYQPSGLTIINSMVLPCTCEWRQESVGVVGDGIALFRSAYDGDNVKLRGMAYVVGLKIRVGSTCYSAYLFSVDSIDGVNERR